MAGSNAHKDAGNAHFRLGNYTEALESYTQSIQCLQLPPGSSEQHPILGGRHAVVYQITYEPIAPHTLTQRPVVMSGGTERHVINNTIYDVDGGVNIAASNGTLDIANNIIANVTPAQASHMNLASSTVGSSPSATA